MSFNKWLYQIKGISASDYYGVLSSSDQKELYDEYLEYKDSV